jgi:hypothetical protein
VSDRQKGLLSAIAETFPEVGHRFCLRHIKDNITRAGISLSNEERGIISNLARSDCESDFKFFHAQLMQFKAKAAEYLDGIEKKHWVKYEFAAAFGTPMYNELTSNLSEQANNWLSNDVRSAKPLDAFSMYFRKLSALASDKRQMVVNWEAHGGLDQLVPVMGNALKQRIQASKMCTLIPFLGGGYSIQHLGPKRNDQIHPWRFVDLPEQDCTCGNWKDELFPCVHAIAAAIVDGCCIESLYDAERLSVRHFQVTFNFVFKPMPTTVQLLSDTTLLIPEAKVPVQAKGKRGLKPDPKPK